jgi:phage shock protein PspC (stress-responsive transcriptional regulator)
MKRLTLSQSNKKLSGLCGGIAEYAGIDATVVRLIVLVGTLVTGILPGLFIYAVASAIVPKAGEVT